LEILRTIDSFERMHSQVALSGLSVALPPGCGPEVLAMLAELVYVPLKAFDLSAWLDVSALGDDAARVATACTLNELCAIGGALRPRMQATGRQQLQLLDPHSALMSPGSWHARLAVKLAAGMLALCAVAAVALSVMTAYYTRQAMSLEDDLTKLRVSVTSVPKAAIIQEVEVLKQKEARQRQLRDTLQSTVAAASLGYSDFLLALGRQTSGSLWITRLSVRGDGQDLELSGRMTNPAALPAYLQQLEREDRFRGRRFAQIDMRALPADAHLPDGVVQFTLSGREAAERGTKEAKP
jgi:Tfp pilus assembly protein PilN